MEDTVRKLERTIVIDGDTAKVMAVRTMITTVTREDIERQSQFAREAIKHIKTEKKAMKERLKQMKFERKRNEDVIAENNRWLLKWGKGVSPKPL